MADEYIRKQDAIDIMDDFQVGIENGEGNYSWAKFKMNELEPADVVKVVRCWNCKHHSYDDIFCEYWCEHPGRVRETTADGFCEKGEE